MIEYFKEQVPEAIEHAKDEFPNESCGCIIDGFYEPFKNKSPSPEDSFLIQSDRFNRYYIEGRVECIIHSHNNYPYASVEDQDQQKEMEVPFGIINLVNKSVKNVVFWGDQLPIQDLIGRPFFWGVWDCWALVRDAIRIKYNINTPNPSRDYGFWFKTISMFEKYIEGDFPFDYVDLRDIEPGDCLLYNMHGTKYLNHVAMMAENNKVLHHFENQISGYKPVMYCREFMNKACRFNPNWRGFNDTSLWNISEEVS
jgi:proteasome lid subunit RPN8/RPN11